ncbi:MAG: hypothetical protein GY700_06095, partial [Propionibacteriaceae bacterium]|nr:hypothetical protein [Propionibacteriaceae bacterium]
MIKKILILFVVLMLTLSCAVKKDIKLGQQALENEDWDAAVTHLLKAMQRHPGNVELRITLSNALISASSHHLTRGKVLLE